jgi:hypothetical protein
MSDPLRLLDDASELSDEERRLLVAGRAMAPPAVLSAGLWAGLSTKLPQSAANAAGAQGGGAAQGGLASGGAAQGSGLGLLIVKAVLVVSALGALAVVGDAWWRAHAAENAPRAVQRVADQVTPPTVSELPSPSALNVPPTEPSLSSVTPSNLPMHAPSSLHAPKPSAPAPTASSDAREESRVVAAARDALHSGDSAGALNLLAQARQRFGNGVLGQEREALLIEALAKSGQGAAARAHGQAFLKNYANSPYAARVQQIVGAP